MHRTPVLLVLPLYMLRAVFLPIIRSCEPYIGFDTFYTVVMNPLLPGVGWNFVLLMVANGSSQVHKMYQRRCTAKNSWWWAERLPETCRVVIPVKLEFSASVGFIHKDTEFWCKILGYGKKEWGGQTNKKVLWMAGWKTGGGELVREITEN